MSQARRWCFTWNNYPEVEPIDPSTGLGGNITDDVWINALKKAKYKYLIVGKEVGDSGTKHLQGYMEFTSGKRFETLQKALVGVHWERANGNAQQNITYCSKGGEVFEDGDVSEQGKRNDLIEAMADIKIGMKELDFFETHPMVMFKYPRACDRYRTLCEKETRKGFNKKEVAVLWGETGTGKTRAAMECFPDAFIVSTTQTGLWWDGYDGEECVVFDEFRDNAIGLAIFLRFLDGYYCQVPIKGGSKTLMAKNIIITSNVDPQDWYAGCDRKSRAAMFRRFDEIIYFKANGDQIVQSSELEQLKHINPMAGPDVSSTR